MVRHIAVVGGGTAGWLATLMVQEAAKRFGLDVKLTMIESSKIPTVGVGEGSTSVFRQLLIQLGLDEFEFLKETEATIKYGIRHKDWRKVGVTYDGPIDDPHLASQTPQGVTSSWINQYCIASGKSVQEPHLFSYLLDRGKAPYAKNAEGKTIPVGPFHHAFHFDQALVAKFLHRRAKGIDMLDAEVSGVKKDPETGDIVSLLLDEDRTLDVDFVIDCTGFSRALIVKEMGAEWVSYGDDLPVNRAMPFWVDLKDGEELNPFTLAWAQKSGWMWSIPTRSRYGCGYVYSDHFTSPDEAQAEIEQVLGHKIEPRNDIKINSGRLNQSWIGNCLAVGLAQSFLEPLEATSIHGTIVQLMLFTQFHLAIEKKDMARNRRAFNDSVARQVDDFRDFINLHYVTERRDTDFWKAVDSDYILPQVRDRVAQWSKQMPRRDHFAPFPANLPHIEDQLYYPVLDGLGLLPRAVAREEMSAVPKLRAHARKIVDFLVKDYKRAATQAPGHRAFLASLGD